ncbi:hypothetical protein NDU88_007075 [Pleurodeles waltl]|uniref:Uncharacterized protein n=1 Tax=Pleurodeles waltl TaxID=8319 RepID=A0AAV7TZM8_PLEWA|nr:hypothetical protein NDU88_007075 [Pleurodeles waltl]
MVARAGGWLGGLVIQSIDAVSPWELLPTANRICFSFTPDVNLHCLSSSHSALRYGFPHHILQQTTYTFQVKPGSTLGLLLESHGRVGRLGSVIVAGAWGLCGDAFYPALIDSNY